MPIFPPPFRPFYPYYNSRRFSPYMPHPTQPNEINVTNDNRQILNKIASDRPVLNELESANFEHIYIITIILRQKKIGILPFWIILFLLYFLFYLLILAL